MKIFLSWNANYQLGIGQPKAKLGLGAPRILKLMALKPELGNQPKNIMLCQTLPSGAIRFAISPCGPNNPITSRTQK